MKKILVVGAGLTGLTIARCAAEKNIQSTVIDARDHIGGNAFSEIDPKTNIDVHKYGSHIFHTNNERIWEFVNRFSDWVEYRHKVFTSHKGMIYSFPINLLTLQQYYGKKFTPEQAENLYLSFETNAKSSNDSFEDRAIKAVGLELYESFFKEYTLKQWGTDPKNLPGETFSRIPRYSTYSQEYFRDKYQGIPKISYGKFCDEIADHPNISLEFQTKFKYEMAESKNFDLIIWTGPIDNFFSYKFGELGYRSIELEFETLNIPDFQGTTVVNFPDLSENFTRIHEFRHFKNYDLKTNSTIIAREYPKPFSSGSYPAYPINSTKDRDILLKYNLEVRKNKGIIFAGRLGTYKYLDMHMAIGAALTLSDQLFNA